MATSTGLSDSDGKEIFIGDILRENTDFNVEMHGEWVEYAVAQRGLTPVLLYHQSEKGQVLPKGYTGTVLCDMYDNKNFIFINNTLDLRPSEADIKIVKSEP